MKRSERSPSCLAAGLLVGLALAVGGCATAPQGGAAAGAAPAEAPPATAAAVAGPEQAAAGYKYVCGCGPSCDCDTSSNRPGTCSCGKPLTYKKIIREDSSYYWVCQGDSDKLSKGDNFMCADGKPLQAMLKQGRYVCACPDCNCGTVSQRNGVCSCGKPMKASP